MDPLAWRTVVARCLIGSTVKLVAYTLANYASGDGGSVRPGVALLVKDTELGDRTVRDALTLLRGLGLIERTFHASLTGLRDKADEYRLTFPDDLGERVAMWDPKRRMVTKGGMEVAPPEPATRKKRTKAPATPAGGSTEESSQAPASAAGGWASESPETGHDDGSNQGVTTGNHRQLLPEPPATVTGTTGRSCRPSSHAPSQAPSHYSHTSDHFGSVEGDGDRAEPKSDLGLSYQDAFKVIQSLGGEIDTFVAALHADATEHGHDPLHGQALTIAVAKVALVKYPQLLPERRTA
ncbi:hypothetical protein AB0F17_08635 [Nonomuraea sp. NPDC026600]|uniref:hypothetical protein n=1 Tax=Nonomuraea sp. NPDC026600 TaxID=3155363 RepID=UPI0033F7685B